LGLGLGVVGGPPVTWHSRLGLEVRVGLGVGLGLGLGVRRVRVGVRDGVRG
jgi:hypothetical protein